MTVETGGDGGRGTARAEATHLWLTFLGAPRTLVFGWLAWLAVALLTAPATLHALGPGGVVMAVFTAGWLLGRRLPMPVESLRRYHLDDAEVTLAGPGRLVRRCAWSQVTGVTQERHALALDCDAGTIRLPLGALRAASAWGPVLARIVPNVAAELWTRLTLGPVHRRPRSDPSLRAVASWAWLPLAAACAAAADPTAIALAILVALGERGVAWIVARTRAVTLDHRGITVLGAGGRRFVPWIDAVVTPEPGGLGVGRPGHDPGLVPAYAVDFWALAPVIELRAQLGVEYPGEVCFRARVHDGGLAVVGEIDAVN